MPLYRYRAVSPAGEVSTGESDASNESDLVDRLRDQGLMPTQIVASAGSAVAASGTGPRAPRRRLFASKHVTRDQLLAITRSSVASSRVIARS